MHEGVASDRSHEPITSEDLGTLASLAAVDREKFFLGRPEYCDRLLCVALCQGAALHFVDTLRGADRPTGVKDFDVWSFFAAVPGERFPADRRSSHVDFGPSKFGRWEHELDPYRHFDGRRVDLFMRALPVLRDVDPAEALVDYLREARTKSAKHLAAKGVVLIEPVSRSGEVVWPPVQRGS